MRRRGMTVLVGAVLVVVLTILVGRANVPYVQLEPGPTYDTLGVDENGREIIVVNGATVSKSNGQLRFVTVGVQPRLTLLQALIGWWRDDEAVVPRELIYPPDQSETEVEKRNAEDFANSGSAAEAAALGELGFKMQISVKTVAPNTPASGKLQPGDVIESVDGVAVNAADKLLQEI